MTTPPPEILFLDEVDSTNAFALENYSFLDSGTMILARTQSAGRGSHGRHWCSPPDVNIYASLVLKDFPFPSVQASRIGALAVLEVVRARAPRAEPLVKWPNDVLCGGRKIAGVLCEGLPDGIVLGIGLNVNMTAAQFGDLGDRATSLALEAGQLFPSVPEIAVELRDRALSYTKLALTSGIAPLHELWSGAAFLTGRRVCVRIPPDQLVTGLAVDCTPNGELVVIEDATRIVYTLPSAELLSW